MRVPPSLIYIPTRTVGAAFQLMRPGNVALIVCATLLGAILGSAGTSLSSILAPQVILATVSIALLGAGANVMNDIIDVDIDRINRPDRPLVSGLISVSVARGMSGMMLAAGISIPLLLLGSHITSALFGIFLVSVYNLKLKQMPLVGNLAIGILSAGALFYGALAVQINSFARIAIGFAFLTTLAREIVKDMEDVDGDASAEMRTFPLSAGSSMARNVSVTVICVTILMTPIPFLFLHFSGLYLTTVILADAALIRALMLLFEEQIDAGAVSGSLKWSMVLGMAALLTAVSPLG